MTWIRDYDFHPPDDLRLFCTPKSGVLRLDGEAFVAEVRYGDVDVRHYAPLRDHGSRSIAPPTWPAGWSRRPP